MNKTWRRPRKSLRTLLITWLLLFSVAPLGFITGYSLRKYRQAIDQELSMRLNGNSREIEVIFEDFERSLAGDLKRKILDKTFIHYLSTANFSQAREDIKNWLGGGYLSRVWVYNGDGRLEIALHRSESGEVAREETFESSNVYLNEDFLKSAENRDSWSAVSILSTKTELRPRESGARMELAMYAKAKNTQDKVVGFVEAVLLIDQNFINNLRNRMNLEIVLTLLGKEQVFATMPELGTISAEFFTLKSAQADGFFDLNLKESPYRFMVKRTRWGDSEMVLGIGASKQAASTVLKNINYAFFTVVGTIVVLLIFLSIVSSKILLRPISIILDALRNIDFDAEPIKIPVNNDTELGLLAEGYNDMSHRVFTAQKALKEKIKELESANAQIREAQTKLVHTAKMASLGQLVAGVAHELNNPIGFIYSNMSHLRDYSQKLIKLVEAAEAKATDLKKEKSEVEYDYILKDLPKLITSCEEGARRTRDIVLGLRNFSRLEEAQLKDVDLHEGLDNTLSLLSGEMKNRIEVTKQYGRLPKVHCYASQLNQVFMNILSNAVQAIEGSGQLTIRTEQLGADKVQISIKDTGKGMSKQTLEKIFDPFFTTKATGKGTGLGLSISYGIIQSHGGEIIAHSEPGRGTEFKIVLPIKGPHAT